MPGASDDRTATPFAVAFGEAPGARPVGGDDVADRWLRAVGLGAQGWFAAAGAVAERLTRDPVAPRPWRSRAASLGGSLVRQQGRHAHARVLDGRALLLAGTHPGARADALVGLAADALGTGRFEEAAALLDLAAPLETVPGLAEWEADRLQIRRLWVTGELALVQGDPDHGVEVADRARRLAEAHAMRRLAWKSELIGLVARGVQNPAASAASLAVLGERLLAAGQLPLAWAAAAAGAGASDTEIAGRARQSRDRLAGILAARGAHLSA